MSQNPKIQEDATVLEQMFTGETKKLKLLNDYEEIVHRLSY